MVVSALGAGSPRFLFASGSASSVGGNSSSVADAQLLSRLQARDREVRAHEAAHMAAGAGLITRGAAFTYETGPDGKRYAVGGEVGIDVSGGRTPEETLAKAERIRAAALAPAEPSTQDRQVAAEADRMAAEARMALLSGESDGEDGSTGGAGALYSTAAAVEPGSQVDVWA